MTDSCMTLEKHNSTREACMCASPSICQCVCVNKQAAILYIDVPARAIMLNNVSVKIDGQLKDGTGLSVCV